MLHRGEFRQSHSSIGSEGLSFAGNVTDADKEKSPRISSMLWRKAVFYSINLLIYGMNTSSINSVRLRGCGKYRSFRGVRLLNRLNDVAR